ncbi:MOSC domain-containing protein YiiM [Jatrophihabitans sp. GAS493]|uniref:MOSC and FAD-binding oxidoreductase domain-containing protein n=1 Tax=Jatrophihabitans sp. GAS493 TaxID=1907575 RepID=UPI000BB75485|nr:MOSC and FAD-binding oxidoreductase domain-containing protein [Jatrophihabitans sp. GAS493]SOD74957.1 MOSC domain-containing protein YiiM [Jatrophihabitans sp. GAS493]
MPTLLSVNVGRPRDVAWNGRLVHTGIWKEPVAGRVMARRLNLDGDGQGDLAGHGGEQRAVMVYQSESYAYWERELVRRDLTMGIFGENFTVDGLADDEVCIGDRYRIGEAEFEVTQPRTTCYRVGLRLGVPQMAALLVSHRRPGFYLRVLREGSVQAGDEIVKTATGPEAITVSSTDALLYLPDGDVDTMRRLLNVPALSPGWSGSFHDLIEQADHPQRVRVEPSKPYWPGFRLLRVARLVRETDLVTSVYLRSADGGALPPPKPGQYLTLRIASTGQTPAVRSYSLSASGGDFYRISVKREAHGAASAYIAATLAVGDDIEVAAPRGEFLLQGGDEPIVLLSAGIGVTPVLAMLQALAAQRSSRVIWWLHTTGGPATYALAAEARQLLAALPKARGQVFYTADAASPVEVPDAGVTYGRPDRSVLAGLNLPATAQAYVCGPTGFMDDMTRALADLGLPSSHIHTEAFASRSAINPGVVVAGGRPAPHAPARVGSGPMVTFARVGIATAFGDDQGSLLELAEACDVPTRWSCRTGVCHTCTTPLLSGDVTYSPTPLTEPEAGQVLLCCSRPQSDVVLDL